MKSSRIKRRRAYSRNYNGYQLSNRLLERKKRTRVLIVSALLLALIFLFSYIPAFSEWYMRTVYPMVATLLSSVSGLFPFSLYDLFLIVAVLWLLMIIIIAIVRRAGFVRFLFSLLRFVMVIVAWFYFSWGVAYFREDFYTRGNVEEATYDSEQFRDFTIRFIGQANQSWLDLVDMKSSAESGVEGSLEGSVKDDVFGSINVIDRSAIKKELESVYQKLHEPLRVAFPNGKRNVKPMMFEAFYSRTGISGYFGPFFNEVHVNNYSLEQTYPFTLAHEMAHQFGVALESEANLYAFIVCAKSDNEIVRYSAYLSMLQYLLNDIYRFLPEEYKTIYLSVKPEIIDDLRRNREHWLAIRSEPLSTAQGKVYDAYLKTNKVSSGRENYSEVVGLLVSSYDKFSHFW